MADSSPFLVADWAARGMVMAGAFVRCGRVAEFSFGSLWEIEFQPHRLFEKFGTSPPAPLLT